MKQLRWETLDDELIRGTIWDRRTTSVEQLESHPELRRRISVVGVFRWRLQLPPLLPLLALVWRGFVAVTTPALHRCCVSGMWRRCGHDGSGAHGQVRGGDEQAQLAEELVDAQAQVVAAGSAGRSSGAEHQHHG
jgi:hypothetical protein